MSTLTTYLKQNSHPTILRSPNHQFLSAKKPFQSSAYPLKENWRKLLIMQYERNFFLAYTGSEPRPSDREVTHLSTSQGSIRIKRPGQLVNCTLGHQPASSDHNHIPGAVFELVQSLTVFFDCPREHWDINEPGFFSAYVCWSPTVNGHLASPFC